MEDTVRALVTAIDSAVDLSVDRLSVSRLQHLVAELSGQLDRLAGVRDGALAELHARGAGRVPAPDGPGDSYSPHSIATATWLGSVGPAGAGRAAPDEPAEAAGLAAGSAGNLAAAEPAAAHETAAGCGGAAAGRLVREASLLARLPLLAEAVCSGRIGRAHALVVTRLLDRLDEDALLASQESLLVLAARTDPIMLAHWVRHQIASYCEPAIEAQAELAAQRRYLQLRDNYDGTSYGRFLVPTELTEAMCTMLEALSRRAGDDDDRTSGQRRADSLLEVFDQVAAHGDGTGRGVRPVVSYVLPAGWAAGAEPPSWDESLATEVSSSFRPPQRGSGDGAAQLVVDPEDEGGLRRPAGSIDDPGPGAASVLISEGTSEKGLDAHKGRTAGDCTRGSAGPLERWDAAADLAAEADDVTAGPRPLASQRQAMTRRWCSRGAWSGPQTRTHIETLLCDARIDRVLLDHRGQVRTLTTLSDTATPTQRQALRARDGGCVAHGCTRPPSFCDAHHLVSLSNGGPTLLSNLVLLCRRHHRLWHRGRLRLSNLHAPWYEPPPQLVVRDG